MNYYLIRTKKFRLLIICTSKNKIHQLWEKYHKYLIEYQKADNLNDAILRAMIYNKEDTYEIINY